MAYKGVRDAEGNMNWVEPKKIDDFLKTVDINSLNFYLKNSRPQLTKECHLEIIK